MIGVRFSWHWGVVHKCRLIWWGYCVGPNILINFISVDFELHQHPSALKWIMTGSFLQLSLSCGFHIFILFEWSSSFCQGYFVQHDPSGVMLLSERLFLSFLWVSLGFIGIFLALKVELLRIPLVYLFLWAMPYNCKLE